LAATRGRREAVLGEMDLAGELLLGWRPKRCAAGAGGEEESDQRVAAGSAAGEVRSLLGLAASRKLGGEEEEILSGGEAGRGGDLVTK
jgi:hypothetical protein